MRTPFQHVGARVKLVIFRKGGESGEIAINPERVTHIRSVAGPYTDIYFGAHRVAVEATFQQVLDKLTRV